MHETEEQFYTFLSEILKEGENLEDTGLDGRIIWTGFVWLRTGSNGGLL
jgi:hypothetical protein